MPDETTRKVAKLLSENKVEEAAKVEREAENWKGQRKETASKKTSKKNS